jgi:hypothetical protein
MIRFFKWLLTGDSHICKYGPPFASGISWYEVKQYHCRCETCGKIKSFNMN